LVWDFKEKVKKKKGFCGQIIRGWKWSTWGHKGWIGQDGSDLMEFEGEKANGRG
jgi:hypothetical protein